MSNDQMVPEPCGVFLFRKFFLFENNYLVFVFVLNKKSKSNICIGVCSKQNKL